MPGSGSIYRLASGEFVGTPHNGDAAGLAAAKAALAAGGLLQIGPGCEAIPLGAGWANISLARVTNAGVFALSRFHMADGTDPTKLMFWDASAITTGLIRVATLPDYSGFVLLPSSLGASGQFLKSNGAGVQPSWAAVVLTNALLDGVNHTDTVAQAVLRGALVVGNSTPKWDRLAIGPSGTVLTSNGTDPAWTATPSAVEHNALFHLKPFQVAGNVSMGAASAVITDAAAGGRFANVRVGDRINLDDAHYPASTYGMVATTSGLADPNNITMDRTNTGGAQTGATATVYPGDHWDNTLVGGLLSAGGWGTFDEGSNPGGTIPTCYGSFDFVGYASAGTQRWGFEGASTTSNPNGFNIKKRGSASRVFFNVQPITANRFASMPDLSGTLCLIAGAQNITDKTLIGNNEIQMDNVVGNANGSHLADFGDPTKELYFDLTGITAGTGKLAKWADLSASGQVDFTYVSQTTAINGKTVAATTVYTVPSGKNFVCTRAIVRCTAATAITVGPSFGIGIAAGEDDIVASAAHTLFVAANTYVACLIRDPAALGLSTNVIKLGIDTGATGTSMTLTVEIAGYLV